MKILIKERYINNEVNVDAHAIQKKDNYKDR